MDAASDAPGAQRHRNPTLPLHAQPIVTKHTISVGRPSKIQQLVDEQRRQNFQKLVQRYVNQLLYGCKRESCDTSTCYTSRKRVARNSSASRRLTLLSARAIACSLATQDDPLAALCPGEPVAPSPPTDEDTEEKENRPANSEVSAVKDKGLKDPRSFTQQLFSTGPMKNVESIPAPDPQQTEPETQPTPEESRRKLLRPNNPMEIMDTGRISYQADPVSPIRHREILERREALKRRQSFKDRTPSSPKTKPPIVDTHPFPFGNIHQDRDPKQTPPTTPRQEIPRYVVKTTQTTPDTRQAQSLRILDESICIALVDMCTRAEYSPSQRREAKLFAEQSIFYVFSTPSSLLYSFGGIGDGEWVDFDPESISKSLDVLYKNGWEERVKRSMWTGLAQVFTKPGKGLPNREAVGMIAIALHVLESGLVKDDEVFRIVSELRKSGRVTSSINDSAPDIGLDDELAERLMKRVLRAIALRQEQSSEQAVDCLTLLTKYLQKCHKLAMLRTEEQIIKEYGADSLEQVNLNNIRGGIGLARCTLEWTRTVFMRSWDGQELIKRASLPGACIQMFLFLFNNHENFGILPVDFETKSIGEAINAWTCPVDWFLHSNNARYSDRDEIHILNHRYIFSPSHLVTFFRAINLDIMKKAYETSISAIRMAGQMADLTRVSYPILAAEIATSLNIYFVLTVRRSHLLEDAFNQLIHREQRELMRPLKIRFADGEEGVDQGGVQQEFFSLLITEIVKPDYALFTTDDRTRFSWFCESSIESEQKLELAGVVMGLAVYNGITLPVNFPKALYIKLLGGNPTLDDIGDAWPELAKGMKEMLNWTDGDVGDIFVRTYEYSYSVFDEVRSINMLDAKENGPYYLERPIPRIIEKRPVPPPEPETDTLGGIEDWLPNTVEESTTTNWLGSGLAEILNEMNEREEDEARLTRRETGTTRYTVSYVDLNAEMSSEVSSNEDNDNSALRPEGDWLSSSVIWSEPAVEREGPEPIPAEPSSHQESEPSSYTEISTGTTPIDPNPPILPEIPIEAFNIPLPTDDGSDWDDRLTDFSPTGSDIAEPSSTLGQPSSSEAAGSVVTAATTPLRTSRSPTPLPDKPASPPTEPTREIPEAPIVTNDTREEYVKDYIHWLCNASISRQYRAFATGFNSVVPSRPLQLFSASHLQLMVEGISTPLSVSELQKVAKYEDGYHGNHATIRMFWDVVKEFNDTQMGQLLEFVTSSKRVPVGGVERVLFYIIRNGEDSERLPSSLTCFGRLLLPEYKEKEKLKRKLLAALENSQGFGNP
ncbi:Similar to Ubiquitin-protein ligase E3A; acc. no. Q05086 [Pyronema omphalodes CBS 100304]|uniref:HECT-type E3 ubiquitin transferase n=1 Tax=Pyronema omphalodes (strain CBS 100304) TaxID=1076935 RepID=U4KYU1_PYROM|nr:Similar to Ubiquitin-protein ligase E3A; acc. no. Q05086 [Pyronema omphalodes CBS 100304]